MVARTRLKFRKITILVNNLRVCKEFFGGDWILKWVVGGGTVVLGKDLTFEDGCLE